MPPDPNPIHPDLRPASKAMPRFNFTRRNLKLIRFLSRFQPRARVPADVRVANLFIQSQDAKHQIRLRVYQPKNGLSPAPALVWMHGGGLIIGTPEMDDYFLPHFARELGIKIISVDYRTAPEHPYPTPLEDCYTALAWVFAQDRLLGIDPARVAIGGDSAGGGLAASLAQLARDRAEVRPIFQMLVYPMLDDRSALCPNPAHKDLLTWSAESNRFGWESYLRQECGADEVPGYSVPARRADLRGLPPAWIGVGTLDLFYEEDAAYAERLRQSGVDCDLVVVPGAFHGFDVFGSGIKVVQEFRQAQVEALRKGLVMG